MAFVTLGGDEQTAFGEVGQEDEAIGRLLTGHGGDAAGDDVVALKRRILFVLVHSAENSGTSMFADGFQVYQVRQLVTHQGRIDAVHEDDGAGEDGFRGGLEEVV